MKILQNMLVRIISHPFVQRRPLLVQFVKFSLIGVINTVVSFTAYTFFTRVIKLDPLVANAIAFVMAVSISYVLNKNWTFRDRGRVTVNQYSRFFTISGIGFGLSEVIILVVHHLLDIHDFIAFTVATVIVLFWNFFANRFWTFRPIATDLPK